VNLALVWAIGAALTVGAVALATRNGFVGQDAHAYWSAVQGGGLYDAAPKTEDAFLYSPAFATVIWPLGQLPWWGFYACWVAIETAALFWLVRPLPLRWAVPAFLACVPEIVIGNIYLLLALMVVVGVTRPAAWTFGFHTKITPGAGLLWFAVRRDLRRFLQGAAVAAGVTAVSLALTPTWWADWLRFLADQAGSGDPTFLPRCVLGVVLVVVAARTGRAWILAPAITVIAPVLGAFASLTPLVAIPRLREHELRTRTTPQDPIDRREGAPA
jgi:hypothetical protein